VIEQTRNFDFVEEKGEDLLFFYWFGDFVFVKICYVVKFYYRNLL